MKLSKWRTTTAKSLLGLCAVLSAGPFLLAASPATGIAVRKDADLTAALSSYRRWWELSLKRPSEHEMELIRTAASGPSPIAEAILWRARELSIRSNASDNAAGPENQSVEALLAQAAALGSKEARVEIIERLLKDPNRGSPQERNAAKTELAQLSDSGVIMAQSAMGAFDANGTGGFAQDLPQAERLFRAAASNGFTPAYRELAVLLRATGRAKESIACLQNGAEAGDARAQFQLYNALGGWDAPLPNGTSACHWLQASSDAEYTPAKLELACAALDSDQSSKWPEALKTLEDLSSGSDKAKLYLSQILLYGKYGQPIDLARAEVLLRELAAKKDPGACEELGFGLVTGIWLPKDVESGMRFLEVAAKAGNLPSQNLLTLLKFTQANGRASGK